MIESLTAAQMHERNSLKWNGIINPKTGEAADGAWVAEMDFGTPPHVAGAMKRFIDNGILGYMPRGLPAQACDALRSFYHDRCAWNLHPDDVGLLPDVLTGLHLLLEHLAQPNVPVIVPTPAYMPFLTIPHQHNHPLITVPSHSDVDGNWSLDFDALAQATTKGSVMVLCNPWNPVGRALSPTELKQFAQIALDNDAWIFNDEIHFPLTFPHVTHTPLLVAAPEVSSRTITATAASKGWNVAGLKCAQWIVTDESLREKWLPVAKPVADHATPIGTVAAREAYTNDRDWLDDVREYVAHNAAAVRNIVSSIEPRITVSNPQATYLTWWDCSTLDLGGRSPADIALEDANVAVNAGHTLGDEYAAYLRFNVATPRPALDDMVARVARALHRAATPACYY